MKSIYIILMNTGTIPSRVIQISTRYKYSHVVLSLDDKYKKLYSFGRKSINNFLNGGMVTYGIESEFFKRFKNTECLILKMDIEDKQFKKLKKVLKNYEKHMDEYKYDIKGLLIRFFTKSVESRDNYYVCSQFIATVLKESNIYDFDKEASLVRPKDFMEISCAKKVYEGKFLKIRTIA